MKVDELKASWESLHKKGLDTRTEEDIKKIIGYGTSEVVAGINRKLFRDMVTIGVASIVSAFSIIFFYYIYDHTKHPWIDVSKLVPIQILAFILFFLLFVFSWLEYKLVNRKFTPESVKTFISDLLDGFQKYDRVFTTTVLLLLLAAFFLELDYFIVQEGAIWLFLKIGGSILLTACSYVVIRQYYKRNFDRYIEDLSSYHNELRE